MSGVQTVWCTLMFVHHRLLTNKQMPPPLSLPDRLVLSARSVEKLSRLTSESGTSPSSHVSVMAMMQASLKARSTWHLACRMSILLRRERTFASTMEGSGGLKGRLRSLVRTPPRLPLFLRRISRGRSTAGFAPQRGEDRSWRSSSRLKVSRSPPLSDGSSARQLLLPIHSNRHIIHKTLRGGHILVV